MPGETAIARALREIELLREYRTRLIADVVTGKLDVRGVELQEIEDEETLENIGSLGDIEAEGIEEYEEVADDND